MDVDKPQNVVNGKSTEEPPTKKARLQDSSDSNGQPHPPRESGIAPIKQEYLQSKFRKFQSEADKVKDT